MKIILKTLFFIVVLAIVLVSVFMLYANLPGPKPRQDVSFGITFSARYATDLGLSWKETYLALLDDMQVRKIRIPLYWDLMEKNRGEYDFSDIDWQLDEANKRDAKIVLAMGQKVPRWPECFAPQWATSPDTRKEGLLSFERQVVERYKDHPEVVMWQVENEPFLEFGNCPDFDISLLDEEIALVKSIDVSKPVLTTANGEFSFWVRPADRGDMFGTTLYRDLWSKKLGRYITYPIGPNFFIAKEALVRLLTPQTHFMVIELQAEPWANGWVGDATNEEQFRTMDEHKLVANIEYAKQVGFPEIYLWGAEWWYWMKVDRQYPAIWDTAKTYFQKDTLTEG